ncbi:hypothetical protein N7527_004782 [Penicillium freii]|nr:hypothetical protein N7527_004782 [Penicillium freii]
MPSRRSTAQASASASQGIPESNVAPKRTRRTTTTGPDTAPLSGTQGTHLQPPLSASPIAKTQKQKHWKIVHRPCLQVFKDADRERDESMRSIQRLEADNAEAAAKIRLLCDEKDQSLVRAQALEMQISSLKQQLETSQFSGMASDDLLPWLMQTSADFMVAQNKLSSRVEAEKNKRLAAALPASDVLQETWPAQNGHLGMFDTNSLPGYSLPSNLSLTTQQALAHVNQPANQQVNQYTSPF